MSYEVRCFICNASAGKQSLWWTEWYCEKCRSDTPHRRRALAKNMAAARRKERRAARRKK